MTERASCLKKAKGCFAAISAVYSSSEKEGKLNENREWCLRCSNHVTLNIEPAVAAVLAVFTAVMGTACMPRFKLHGGTAQENLALQNLQVSCTDLITCLHKLLLIPSLTDSIGEDVTSATGRALSLL